MDNVVMYVSFYIYIDTRMAHQVEPLKSADTRSQGSIAANKWRLSHPYLKTIASKENVVNAASK